MAGSQFIAGVARQPESQSRLFTPFLITVGLTTLRPHSSWQHPDGSSTVRLVGHPATSNRIRSGGAAHERQLGVEVVGVCNTSN